MMCTGCITTCLYDPSAKTVGQFTQELISYWKLDILFEENYNVWLILR